MKRRVDRARVEGSEKTEEIQVALEGTERIEMLEPVRSIFYDRNEENERYIRIRQKTSSKGAVVVGLVAAVGGFLYGYDTGLINDILEMPFVKDEFTTSGTFTVHQRSLVTGILSLGTFCGALMAPLISDSYGRKFSIIISSALIFNAGNVLQVASKEINMLCIGRAISGVSVGILSASVPLYQAEASPRWVRGSIVYTYQWAITWGLLIASAICQGTKDIRNTGSYRIPVALQFLWSLILCLGMFFLPESPRFYVQKNNMQRAVKSLARLRRLPVHDEDLIEELVEIKANYDYELSFGKTSYIDCFRSGGGRTKQRLRMLTGIGVQAFQQLSGINFIFYYGVNFFASSGLKDYYLMSFITYLVNTVFTIPGIVLIEVMGRRKLLIVGGIGMGIANLIIAIVGVTIGNHETSGIICVSFSCVFICMFASTWGGGAWALTSDIFSIGIRQKAVSISAATNWLVNCILAFVTPYLIDTGHNTAALGNKIFFIWGGCNIIGAIFVYFIVYETQGLKLEEVDYMYLHCKNAFESTKFKSHKIYYDGDSSLADYIQSQIPKDEDSSPQDPHPTENIQMVLYPPREVASTSDENSDASLRLSVDPLDGALANKSDYEKYLWSLTSQSEGANDNLTACTSKGNRRNNVDMDVGASIPSNLMDSGTIQKYNPTIIAASYFNNPPDTDTDSDTHTESSSRSIPSLDMKSTSKSSQPDIDSQTNDSKSFDFK